MPSEKQLLQHEWLRRMTNIDQNPSSLKDSECHHGENWSISHANTQNSSKKQGCPAGTWNNLSSFPRQISSKTERCWVFALPESICKYCIDLSIVYIPFSCYLENILARASLTSSENPLAYSGTDGKALMSMSQITNNFWKLFIPGICHLWKYYDPAKIAKTQVWS